MISAISSGLTAVIGWVGEVVTALTGASGELAPLLPLLGVGIAVSAFFVGVKAIKGFVWGA